MKKIRQEERRQFLRELKEHQDKVKAKNEFLERENRRSKDEIESLFGKSPSEIVWEEPRK